MSKIIVRVLVEDGGGVVRCSRLDEAIVDAAKSKQLDQSTDVSLFTM